MGTKIWHWTSGVTRFDYTRNGDNRNRYELASIVEKLPVRRFRWCSHVIRAKENSLTNIDLCIKINGKQPKDRLKQRWLHTLDGDLKARDNILIRHSIEPYGETDHDEPTPLVNETQAEEKEEDVRSSEFMTAPLPSSF